MQQSPLFLSSADLNMTYQKLLKNPRLAQELSDYHRTELYHYAEDEALNATRTIVDMMDGTPNYPYPEEYRNGREVEYLLGKHSPAYWDSQRVLQLLAERLVAPQPAETIPTVNHANVKPEATPTTAIPVDFSLYIKEEYREKLAPFLKAVYTGQKPQMITCMLVALQDLEALTTPLQRNVTELHAALETFLGSVGSRQNLADSLTKLDSASEKQNIKIQAQRGRIKTYMEQS